MSIRILVVATVAIVAVGTAVGLILGDDGHHSQRSGIVSLGAVSSPPTLTKVPVLLKWQTVPAATSYRVWRAGSYTAAGTVVETTSLLSATILIPCSGNTLSVLKVQARNPTPSGFVSVAAAGPKSNLKAFTC